MYLHKVEQRPILLRRRENLLKKNIIYDDVFAQFCKFFHAILRQSLSNKKYATTVFGCYIQHCNEVATCKIIDTILLHKFQLALPSIDSNKLSFKIVTKNWRNELELGKFGILEPIKTLPTILPQIVITPVLGFDEKFRRIGYGGGFYDRFFSSYQCYKVGLAINIQEVQNVNFNKFDIPLDVIISDDGIRYRPI